MQTTIAVFALLLAYVALVAAYLALRALGRLRRAAAVLGKGVDSRESIIEAAERHIELTAQVAARLDSLQAEIEATRDQSTADAQAAQTALMKQLDQFDQDATRALRNVALVRYDAFEEMAGRMSFSLALLDDDGDGVTLSAIAGRSDTRVYAKGVHGGSGEHDLSPEEQQAVGAALRRPAGRSAQTPLARRKAS